MLKYTESILKQVQDDEIVKFMKKWLIIGILIRVLIIPFTYHPDLHFFVLGNYLLVYKQMWLGFYDFLGLERDWARGWAWSYTLARC